MNNKIFKLINLKLLIIFILLAFSTSFLTIPTIVKAQSDTSSGDTTYQNIQSFSGNSASTTISNSDTKGLGDVANMILTIMVVVIIGLVIFRILQGAITKGTFDNIYDQQQGNKTIKNAGTALLIFILAYAVLSFINPDLTGWTFVSNVSVNTYESLTGGISGGECGSVGGYTKTDIESMLLQDEGDKTTAYYDSLGIPTIGVGFNLIRNANVKQDLIAAGVSEADATKLASLTKNPSNAGKQIPGYTITSDQIKALLEKDLSTFSAIAKKVATAHGINFDSLPDNVKNVLIDMSYAGEGTFNKFTNMLQFVKDGNYVKAGGQIKYSDLAETQISPYCSQTGDRCIRLYTLMGVVCKPSSSILVSVTGSASNRCEIASKITNSDLKAIDNAGHQLLISRADQFLAMKTAAAKDGITLIVNSAYRSDQSQIDTCKSVCAGNKPACPSGPGTACAAACSLGGNGSNHVTGDAVDIENGCHNGTACSFSSSVAKWMSVHGKDYGFINKLPTDGVHYSSTGN